MRATFRGQTAVPRFTYESGHQQRLEDETRNVQIRFSNGKITVPLVVMDGVHETKEYRFTPVSWYVEDGRDRSGQAYRRIKVFGVRKGWCGFGTHEKEAPESLALQSWYGHENDCWIDVQYVVRQRHPWGKGTYLKLETSSTETTEICLWDVERALDCMPILKS